MRRLSTVSSREYHLRPEPAGQEPGDLGVYRRKLMHLLEESDHYSSETLPTYLLHDGLFDERAIVMGKVGNHQEALIIYVHILKDLQRAEEYCMRVYGKSEKPLMAPMTPVTSNMPTFSGKDVFLLLFKQCLNTPNPSDLRTSLRGSIICPDSSRPPLQLSKSIANYINSSDPSIRSLEGLDDNVKIAIAILARHATRINLRRAIEMLPPELPLAALTTILTQSMEHTTSRKNYVQILRQLLHAQRLRAHQARIHMEQASRLVVHSHDICAVCAKKIGKRFVC